MKANENYEELLEKVLQKLEKAKEEERADLWREYEFLQVKCLEIM